MKKKLIIGLSAINGVLAALLLATPAETQIIPLGWFNCCQPLTLRSQSEYCCRGCCWFIPDCDDDKDCVPTE
jgi:hypothetical protein